MAHQEEIRRVLRKYYDLAEICHAVDEAWEDTDGDYAGLSDLLDLWTGRL
jgi:hypothetical protein